VFVETSVASVLSCKNQLEGNGIVMNSSASKVSENNEVQWYGKPEKKVAPKTGDPIICFIVGGTCYAEVGKCSKKGEGWDDG